MNFTNSGGDFSAIKSIMVAILNAKNKITKEIDMKKTFAFILLNFQNNKECKKRLNNNCKQ